MGKKKIVAIVSIVALMISLFVFTPDSNAGVATMNLTKQKKTISVGQSFQLKLDGLKASKVKWSSSKPSVASVSKKGIVKGLTAGTTNIIGKYKGIKFLIKVTVKAKPTEKTEYGIPLGTYANVELYLVKITKDTIYIKAINNNNYNIQVFFDYINVDDTTFNDIGGSFDVMKNSFRTYDYYVVNIPSHEHSFSGPLEIWTADYEPLAEANINVSLE